MGEGYKNCVVNVKIYLCSEENDMFLLDCIKKIMFGHFLSSVILKYIAMQTFSHLLVNVGFSSPLYVGLFTGEHSSKNSHLPAIVT